MKTLQHMFHHMKWANDRIYSQLQQAGNGNERTLALFSHVLAAERIWLTRLQQQDSSGIPVWENLSLEECEQAMHRNSEDYTTFLANCIDLDANCTYKNLLGKVYTSTIREILMHVALHGQYHRGQINAQ